MTKDELENRVNELELTLNSLELNAKVVKDDLIAANKRLEDVSKPTITKEIVNDIREAIEQVLNKADFSEPDSYEVEFEIDYNNSLCLGNIEYNNVDQLSEEISDSIEYLFNIIDDKDEN
jgi:hypothetical protein